MKVLRRENADYKGGLRTFHLSIRLLSCVLAGGTIILAAYQPAFRALGSLGSATVFYLSTASTILLPIISAIVMFWRRDYKTNSREWAIDWIFVLAWCSGFWLFALLAFLSYPSVV